MKLLFVCFYENIIRFLMPSLLSGNEEVYVARNTRDALAVLAKSDFDFVIVDIDNCDVDVVDFVKKSGFSYNVKWIFFTYRHEDWFLDLVKRKGIFGVLSKNIHPDSLYIKLKKMIYEEKEGFSVYRRKYYRADIASSQNSKVTIYVPTVKRPLFGKVIQLSIIGMQVRFKGLSNFSILREGQFLTDIYLSLNGYRLELAGKIIKVDGEKGIVILFSKMKEFVHDEIARFIYRDIENYLSKISSINTRPINYIDPASFART